MLIVNNYSAFLNTFCNVLQRRSANFIKRLSKSIINNNYTQLHQKLIHCEVINHKINRKALEFLTLNVDEIRKRRIRAGSQHNSRRTISNTHMFYFISIQIQTQQYDNMKMSIEHFELKFNRDTRDRDFMRRGPRICNNSLHKNKIATL